MVKARWQRGGLIMSDFDKITQAYADAVGRFNSATKNLSGFLIMFREAIEQELGMPAMSVLLFPIEREPNKDYSGSPDVAQFDGNNSWQVGLAIPLGPSQSVTYRIILDMRNGQYFARIGPDGEPYEVKKDIMTLTNTLTDLAIERLSKLSIDPNAKESYLIEIKQG
jgi:hypothetical protein